MVKVEDEPRASVEGRFVVVGEEHRRVEATVNGVIAGSVAGECGFSDEKPIARRNSLQRFLEKRRDGYASFLHFPINSNLICFKKLLIDLRVIASNRNIHILYMHRLVNKNPYPASDVKKTGVSTDNASIKEESPPIA